MDFLHPKTWKKPSGFSNGTAARGTTIFVAGQVGWDGQCVFRSDDFVAQCDQALANVVAVLAEAGAGPQHIARMTWYVLDKQEYLAGLAGLGEAYKRIIGPHYPAMTLVQVSALVEDRARVEIEATAVLPD